MQKNKLKLKKYMIVIRVLIVLLFPFICYSGTPSKSDGSMELSEDSVFAYLENFFLKNNSSIKDSYMQYYNYVEKSRKPGFIGNQNVKEKDMSIEEITAYYGSEPEIEKYSNNIFFPYVFGEFVAYPVIKAKIDYPDNELYKYMWKLDDCFFYRLLIFYRKEKGSSELIPICGYITDYYGFLE